MQKPKVEDEGKVFELPIYYPKDDEHAERIFLALTTIEYAIKNTLMSKDFEGLSFWMDANNASFENPEMKEWYDKIQALLSSQLVLTEDIRSAFEDACSHLLNDEEYENVSEYIGAETLVVDKTLACFEK